MVDQRSMAIFGPQQNFSVLPKRGERVGECPAAPGLPVSSTIRQPENKGLEVLNASISVELHI